MSLAQEFPPRFSCTLAACVDEHTADIRITPATIYIYNYLGILPLTQPRIPGRTLLRGSIPSRASDQLRPCGRKCQSITRLAAQPSRSRKVQGILQRALLAVECDPHRQVPLVQTNVANTEVGKQGFRRLWIWRGSAQKLGQRQTETGNTNHDGTEGRSLGLGLSTTEFGKYVVILCWGVSSTVGC